MSGSRPFMPSLLALSLPLFFLLFVGLISTDTERAPAARPAIRQGPTAGRLVVVIVDSLRARALDDHMPHTRAWVKARGARRLKLHTCTGNLTLSCIQTMVEGRQSPVASGLHNFSGKKGSEQSVTAIAHRSGLKVSLISDYTMHSLYREMASFSMNIEEVLKAPYLLRDKHAIKVAGEQVKSQKYDAIFLHIIGTDKAAHYKNPGHPGYIKHFEEVDEALGVFLNTIGPEDHVLIVGDHGHDQKGHHNRHSIALFDGPAWSLMDWSEAGPRLEQTELAYMMSVALGVPTPSEYEGRLFGLGVKAGQTPEAARRFREELRATLAADLERSGYRGETLEARAEARTQYRHTKHWLRLGTVAPLLVLYLHWVLLAFLGIRNHRVRWFAPPLALGFWGVGLIAPPWLMGLLAMFMLGAGAVLARRLDAETRQQLSFPTMVLVAALVPALLNHRWTGFFLSHGGFQWTMLLLFGGLIVCGMGLSWLRTRSWREHLPASIGALILFALPSGVYYYQFGQNIMRGLFIGALLVGLAALTDRSRREALRERARAWSRTQWFAAALLVITGALTQAQRATGEAWYSKVARALKYQPDWVVITVFALTTLPLLALVRTPRARAALVSVAVGIGVFSGLYGKLPWHDIAATQLIIVLLASLLTVARQHGDAEASRKEQLGVWGIGLFLMALWTMFSGFFMKNVEFQFALATWNHLERSELIALLVTLSLLAKYGLPMLLVPLVWFFTRPKSWREELGMVVIFGHFKLLCLLAQLAASPLFGQDQRYERAIFDVMFLSTFLFLLLATMGVLQLVERRTRATLPLTEAIPGTPG